MATLTNAARIEDHLKQGELPAATRAWCALPIETARANGPLFHKMVITLADAGATRLLTDLAAHCAAQTPRLITEKRLAALARTAKPMAAAILARAALCAPALRAPGEIISFARACVQAKLARNHAEAVTWARPEKRTPAEWLALCALRAHDCGAFDFELDLLTHAMTLVSDPDDYLDLRLKRVAALQKLKAPGAESEKSALAPSLGKDPYLLMKAAAVGIEQDDNEFRQIADYITFRDAPGDCCLVATFPFHKRRLFRILTPVFDQLVARGVSLAILDEPSRTLLIRGFGPWVGQPDRAAVEFPEMMARLGKTHLAMMGVSGAGYSAFHHGGRMQVDGILTFSGVSYIPAPEEVIVRRAVTSINRIRAMLPPGPHDTRDILALAPDTLCHYYYPRHSPFDVDQFEHIADLPNVKPFPVESTEHGTVQLLHDQGTLDRAVLNFVRSLGWID